MTREGDFLAIRREDHKNLNADPPKRTVVSGISNDVFFRKGPGSPPSGISARHTRSTENTDTKVSNVNPASILANARYARAATC